MSNLLLMELRTITSKKVVKVFKMISQEKDNERERQREINKKIYDKKERG